MKMNESTDWLLALADRDEGGCVSTGGLVHRLAAEEAQFRTSRTERAALAKLIQLRRRERQMSAENLADLADVNLGEVIAVERGQEMDLEPRTVHKIAQALELPERRLMQLAGLAGAPDSGFRDAAVRFAARSEPIASLSAEERAALDEYVKFLAGA